MLNQPQQKQPLSQGQNEQAQKAYQIGDNLMWNKQIFDSIMQEIEKKGPVEGISDAVVMILSKAKESMGGLDKSSAAQAGSHLLMQLIDAIQQTGKVEVDSAMLTEILGLAVQKYLMVSQAEGESMDDLPQLMQTFGGGA